MLEVATQQSTNPVSILAQKLNLPISPIKLLPLPAKLMFPSIAGDGSVRGFTMLGLGDIVVPGIFLAFVLRYEVGQGRVLLMKPFLSSLFVRAVCGYVVALVISFVFNALFEAAQPALLYLVPGIVAPVVVSAVMRGELAILWTQTPCSPRSPHNSTPLNSSDSQDLAV